MYKSVRTLWPHHHHHHHHHKGTETHVKTSSINSHTWTLQLRHKYDHPSHLSTPLIKCVPMNVIIWSIPDTIALCPGLALQVWQQQSLPHLMTLLFLHPSSLWLTWHNWPGPRNISVTNPHTHVSLSHWLELLSHWLELLPQCLQATLIITILSTQQHATSLLADTTILRLCTAHTLPYINSVLGLRAFFWILEPQGWRNK